MRIRKADFAHVYPLLLIKLQQAQFGHFPWLKRRASGSNDGNMTTEGSQVTKLGPSFDVTDVPTTNVVEDKEMEDDAQSPYRHPFGCQEGLDETPHAYSAISEGASSVGGCSETESDVHSLSEPVPSVRRSASRRGRTTLSPQYNLKYTRSGTLRSKSMQVRAKL